RSPYPILYSHHTLQPPHSFPTRRSSDLECGFYPGLDEVLRDVGLQFFFTESHGLLYADPRPRYGVHAPVFCPTGVAAFARDLDRSEEHTSELQSRGHLVCRLLLEKKKEP